MNYIDALERVIESEDLRLCDDPDERSGEHESICVYDNVMCIGKVRFYKREVIGGKQIKVFHPEVDESLIEVLDNL